MATIQVTLAAGSVASPYYLDVKITKQLCAKTPQIPVFQPVFTLTGYNQVGTVTEGTTVSGYQYEAIVNVQGVVTYTPCGQCCAKTQMVSEQIVIPFFSTSVPGSVSIASGNAVNTLVTSGGCSTCCSNVFVSDVPVTLTVTSAA